MDDGAFFFQGVSLLLPKQAFPPTPTGMEIPLAYVRDFPASGIFTIPSGAFSGTISCVLVPPESPLPSHWQAVPVRQAIATLPEYLAQEIGPAARLLRAFHIAQWRRESFFCGSCGVRNTDLPGELARLCPACGRVEFPRIAPAVITLITNDEGKILLAHNTKFDPGVYGLIAGFAEAGESLEAAVVREVCEEVGLEIRDLQYLVSQPWPFPNSLMVGFSARHAAGTIRPDRVEIEDAGWFSRDKLPALPGAGSVSRYLINCWIEGKLSG